MLRDNESTAVLTCPKEPNRRRLPSDPDNVNGRQASTRGTCIYIKLKKKLSSI